MAVTAVGLKGHLPVCLYLHLPAGRALGGFQRQEAVRRDHPAIRIALQGSHRGRKQAISRQPQLEHGFVAVGIPVMPGIGAGEGEAQQKLPLRVPQMHHFTRAIRGIVAQKLLQIVVTVRLGGMDARLNPLLSQQRRQFLFRLVRRDANRSMRPVAHQRPALRRGVQCGGAGVHLGLKEGEDCQPAQMRRRNLPIHRVFFVLSVHPFTNPEYREPNPLHRNPLEVIGVQRTDFRHVPHKV